MVMFERNIHEKKIYLNKGPIKIVFLPIPDMWKDGQTVINSNRVASLLKTKCTFHLDANYHYI